MIHDVTMETFENTVDTNEIVVLDFWAAWCGPCKIFAPIYEEAALQNPDVFFGKVNTEVAKDLTEAFQIRSVPTVLIFKKAELVFEKAGVIPPGILRDLLANLRTSVANGLDNQVNPQVTDEVT